MLLYARRTPSSSGERLPVASLPRPMHLAMVCTANLTQPSRVWCPPDTTMLATSVHKLLKITILLTRLCSLIWPQIIDPGTSTSIGTYSRYIYQKDVGEQSELGHEEPEGVTWPRPTSRG